MADKDAFLDVSLSHLCGRERHIFFSNNHVGN